MTDQASRPVSDLGEDDLVTPFAVTPLDVRGRLVRLGPALDRILSKHNYPAPIARIVGEAATLAVLLGSVLKTKGRFQLQTRTNGALDMLVVDFEAPDRLRAFARYDEARLAAMRDAPLAEILGSGHLALTIDHGSETTQYQGVTPLSGDGLEEAAHRYFAQSEQIPTLVRLAVAEEVSSGGRAWRAGGLLVQFLPAAPERLRRRELDPGDAPLAAEGSSVADDEDDAWAEAKALAGTVRADELVDPGLSSERLLYRLFHERGVGVFEPQSIRDVCRCSRDRVASMLRSFPAKDRADMIGEDGRITVTCEFCSETRWFEPSEFDSPEDDSNLS